MKILGLFAVGLLAAPLASHAVLMNYGTGEGLSFRDCIAGVSGCDDVSGLVLSVFGGLPGDATSVATASLPGYGASAGTVSLSGTIGAPILHASANSDLGKRLSTNSVALQSYTYTGDVADTRTFGGTLTYSQSLSGSYPQDNVGNGVFAAIDVFKLPSSTIDVGDTAVSNFLTLLRRTELPGYSELDSTYYTDESSTLAGFGAFGVTVTLNPGDTVWVWALLATPAANGSSVDASNTFVTSWDKPDDLTPAVSVPEPATLALLTLGLAGLGFSRRKK